jgi:hypothetical protein
MIRTAAMLLGLLLLQSCSTEKYVKRQLAKHPEWGTTTDTTRTVDTLRVLQSVHDTTFILRPQDSTETHTLENDTVKVVITRYRDRMQVRTILKEQKVPYTKEVIVNRKVVVQEHRTFADRLMDMLGRWALTAIIIWLLLRWLKKLWDRMKPPTGRNMTLVC